MRTRHGPWKILGRGVKYRNPWMTVEEDRVLRPDGKKGIFGWIRFTPGVSILPLDGRGRVYLTEEFRYAIGRRSIEAASGGISRGEAPLQAAKRELQEELGLSARKWTYLGRVDPFTSFLLSPAYLYLARVLSAGNTHQEGTELIKPLCLKLEEAVRMVMNGRITHAPTCTLIMKASRYLQRGGKIRYSRAGG